MKSVNLKAYPRNGTGRGSNVQRRLGGRVPAVIYGQGKPARNLEVSNHELGLLLGHHASEHLLVDLSIDGSGETLAILQEVQHHPVSRKFLHVDFREVTLDQKVTVTVPLRTSGDCLGVKLGGVLELVSFSIKITGRPKDLPEVVDVDVTNLDVGTTLHLGELQLPEGVSAVGNPQQPVISVAGSRAARSEADAASTTEDKGKKGKK